MKKFYILNSLLVATALVATGSAWTQTTFNYTGAVQTYTVPAGVGLINVDVYGGDGYGTLGLGGRVQADIPVTPGDVLNIYVGGAGTETTGGFNGGGDAGTQIGYGGGGGASDIRQGGTALANRIIVAGGGGGTGSNCGTNTAEGGHGGGLIAESGCLYSCSDCQYTGAGGTQSSGGIAGPTGHGSCGGNQSGSLGLGGTNTTGGYGTGGGGGYYGGGSGCFEGAGGGSSYTFPAATNVIHTVGVQTGNGMIIITPLCDGLTTNISSTTVCLGESVTLEATSTNGGTINWDGGIFNGTPFTPTSTGTLSFTANSTSLDDCSFSVDIEIFDLPTVTAMVNNAQICQGESVTFTGGGADTYTWNNSVTNGFPFSPTAIGLTTYTVTGTVTATGCGNTASVDVTVSSGINFAVTSSNELFGNDGSINLTMSGGIPPYTFDWDNDGTGDNDDTEDLTGLNGGTYVVVVDDQSACPSETLTVIIADFVGISDAEQMGIALYPNPTTDLITLEYAGEFTYALTTVTGELVLSGNASDKETISMNAFANGTYFLTFNNDAAKTIRVVKK